MALPPELSSSIQKLQQNIAQLTETFEPFLKKPIEEHFESCSPSDIANFELAVAYSINTLLFIKAKLSAENMTNHPILGELERLKSYFKKIKSLTVTQPKEEGEIENSGQTVKLNKDAANRFIQNALQQTSTATTTE